MIEAQIKEAMQAAGLGTIEPLIAGGRVNRFRIEGDRAGSKNGWAVLFDDGLPAGSFGNWKTGEVHKWCAKSDR